MFNQWYNSVIGTKVDEDSDSSYDCVDIPKSWLEFLFPSVLWVNLTGWGNAKDLFNNSNPQYVDKINYSSGLVPLQGDIIVWGATSTNPYGHIAVVISANDNSVTVIEENSYTQAAAYTATRSYANVIGFLRPKGVLVETFKDTNDVRVNGFNLFGIDIAGSDPALQAWVGKPKLDFFKGLGATIINNTNALKQQVSDLQSQVASLQAQIHADPSVTVSQSGLWAAFKRFLGL